MSKIVRAALIGLVVAFVVGFGFGWIDSLSGEASSMPYLAGAFAGVFTTYILGNLAGNKKVDTINGAEKERALAFAPSDGKALIIVYRTGFIGSAAGLNVRLDGKEVAQLKSPRFTIIPTDPGPRVLSAGFGGLAGPQNKDAETPLVIEAGQVLCFKPKISMGALRNTVTLEEQPVADDLRRTLRGMTMVRAEI
ncbi:MAG: hypothetical protein U1E50_17190 [Caulobacteraceae bacterium]